MPVLLPGQSTGEVAPRGRPRAGKARRRYDAASMARAPAALTARDRWSMSYSPWWRRPLMKNVGVPDTPLRSGGLHVLGDPVRPDVPLQLVGEARHVERESAGVRHQISDRQLVLVLEQLVMHLPERALIGGGLGGQCRQLDVRVHVCERQVAPYVADVREVAEQLAPSGSARPQ